MTAIPKVGAFQSRRLGFMGQFSVPEDFDTMHADEIVCMFEGEEEEL